MYVKYKKIGRTKGHSLEREKSNDVLEKKSTLLIIDKSKSRPKKPISLDFDDLQEYLTTKENRTKKLGHTEINRFHQLMFRTKKTKFSQQKSYLVDSTASGKISEVHHTKKKLCALRQIFSNFKSFSCRLPKTHLLDSDTDKADDEFQFHQITPLNQWNRNIQCPEAMASRQLPSIPSHTYSFMVSKRATNFDIASNIDKVKEVSFFYHCNQ